MSEPFEETLAALGRTVEAVLARAGGRGVAIARNVAPGRRELVSVVGPGVGRDLLRANVGWDLPLEEAREVETPSGPRTVVLERLTSGVSSTLVEAQGSGTLDGPPPFVLELAERIAATHARGEVAGPLHPVTIFVQPETLHLAAIAGRPLRIGGVVAVEGDPPLFGPGYLAPADVRGEPAGPADDVFRLAALAWRWRHGRDPFPGPLAGQLERILGGAPAMDEGTGELDALDAALLRAFRPRTAERPSAAELREALGAVGGDWYR